MKHEINNQKVEFLRMLLGALGVSILVSVEIGIGVKRAWRGDNNMDHMVKHF